ncbi:DUF2939 domain-containing protein [Hyphomicrobium sp. CS1GBMeth3]|uniref:DUF2939 domain-containing protein n=1 Tax=Hyphomicrobium sp. CS1GBMeth3 TaxID=1892845 RepID=UPI000930B11F|nr:DUF2939 domain-containing protein [Hyphomicrobium sp. CS1GBMeth3]
MSRSRGKSVFSLLKTRSLGTIGVLAAGAFYVAWPLYAGYEIKSSLDSQNVAGLNAHIDFPSVRVSLRPAVTERVEAVLTDALKRAGAAGGALGDQIKASIAPRIVDGVLAVLVTPEMLIRLHASGKSLKEALEAMVMERASGAQGLGGFAIVAQEQGPGGAGQRGIDEIANALGIDADTVLGGGTGAAAASEAASGAPAELLQVKGGKTPDYGIGNIKHFTFSGPLGLSFGIARDPKARKPELTADLTFVDGSWKLTGLVPD